MKLLYIVNNFFVFRFLRREGIDFSSKGNMIVHKFHRVKPGLTSFNLFANSQDAQACSDQ